MQGLRHDGIVPQFAQLDSFCAVVNIKGLLVEDDSCGKFANITKEVEKRFLAKYPNGVTP